MFQQYRVFECQGKRFVHKSHDKVYRGEPGGGNFMVYYRIAQ